MKFRTVVVSVWIYTFFLYDIMAENKKSFVLYADLIHTVNKMPNNKAGELFKHILAYVNDKNPKTDDLIIELTFEPIKQQLKRDLKRYEEKRKQWSDAGKRSAKLRNDKKNQRTLTNVESRSTDSTVNDNVNVNVNDVIDKSITYNKKEFLNDWNELRKEYLKKPSFLNTIDRNSEDNFKKLLNHYGRKDFKNAMIGLFKQKKLPNNLTTMQSNPKHFLKTFESYLTAYYDKNTNLYGKADITI
jgi:hypothetical protein